MNRPTKIGIGIIAGSTALGLIFGVNREEPKEWEATAPPRTYNAARAYEIPATQKIRYQIANQRPRNLKPTLHRTRAWMGHHKGPYRIRRENSTEWSVARNEQQTIDQLRKVLRNISPGVKIQVRAESDKERLFTLKVDLNPAKIIDTEGTRAIDIIIGTTVVKFPSLSEAGIYVCRPIAGTNTLSQHAYANAVDWVGSQTVLNTVAAYQLQLMKQGYLPVSQILWKGRDLISGHGVYDHYGHIHDSGKPLLSGSCRRST